MLPLGEPSTETTEFERPMSARAGSEAGSIVPSEMILTTPGLATDATDACPPGANKTPLTICTGPATTEIDLPLATPSADGAAVLAPRIPTPAGAGARNPNAAGAAEVSTLLAGSLA